MDRNPHKNPNPQGKGLVPVLGDWQATRARQVRPKAPAELLRDWFVSTLVLSAEFRFRPVVGQRYFLYRGDGRWHLSLVGPGEWRDRSPGTCLGECSLRPDMTWDFVSDERGLEEPSLRAELGALVEGFTAALAGEESVADLLPAYRRDLPYYQRMLATGLGASLKQSVGDPDLLSGRACDLLLAAGDTLPLALGPAKGTTAAAPE